MNVTQQTLNAAIVKLQNALAGATVSSDVLSYWTTLLNKKVTLHANGTVQSSCSNPIAYFLVPLSGDGTKGRSHDFVMQQFNYALTHGLTSNAHVALRGVNEDAIRAGMAYAKPRKDSSLGTVEARQAACIVAGTTMADSAKGKAAKEVVKLDAAKIEGNRSSYSNSLDAIAALLQAAEKRNSKTTPAAPAVTKPVQTAPEIVKPAKRKGKGKAA